MDSDPNGTYFTFSGACVSSLHAETHPTGRVGWVQERSDGTHAVGMVSYPTLNPPYELYLQ